MPRTARRKKRANPKAAKEIERRVREATRCRGSFAYFANTYCHILASSDRSGAWVPFRLWPAQEQVAAELESSREIIMLKARQLGFTWLVLAYALHQCLFHPVATVLLFSKRDDEATELLAFRLRMMYERLPDWMRSPLKTDASHELEFSNGSRALAFATTGGRSYTATLAIIDEADHVPDLDRMLSVIKPTTDAGGKIILLSTVDKSQPESPFKKIYRAAQAGQNGYVPIFHGWRAAPNRTDAWYEDKRRAVLAQTGALDDLHQEYPATDIEALLPRSLDKRIPSAWLLQCFVEAEPIPHSRAYPAAQQLPPIPELKVYARPQTGRTYVIGADPAEGNPTSDDSALCVLDRQTGEEVASLAVKLQPATLAGHAYRLAIWYHRAPIMVERNNHGHAVLGWLTDHGHGVIRLNGHDGREGWLSSSLGKVKLYDRCAEAFQNQEVRVHSLATFSQLSSIDGATLRAPEGQHDDLADAFALAVQARLEAPTWSEQEVPCILAPRPDPFGGRHDRWRGVGSIGDEPPPTMFDTSWR
ncbi:MAG TPA: terminase family protein [Gemmataceae bacterium]|nr:terminase family protein [Gemmataceae bacterium]